MTEQELREKKIKERIIEILCPFYADCTYRKERIDGCFNLGSEWGICNGVRKANQILAFVKEAGWINPDDYEVILRKLDSSDARELLKEAGYVRLSKDQSLPENPFITSDCNGRIMGYDNDKSSAYGGAQKQMLKANFRKVKLSSGFTEDEVKDIRHNASDDTIRR